MSLTVHGESHPGFVRTSNEDAFLVVPERGLMVLADGMAGHRFGELASHLAVKTTRRFFHSSELDKVLHDQYTRAHKARLEAEDCLYSQYKLRRALEEANLTIFDTARRNPRYATMGTTVVAILVTDEGVCVGHVGDSRAYRFRESGLELLTSDHSLVNEYVRMQFISQEEAGDFGMKNVIVRALGLRERVLVETGRFDLEDGDTFMLCSDGLSDHVPDASIEQVFRDHADIEERVSRLVELALEAGGEDNITVVLGKWEESA